jgi:alkylhydroperoxidase family enzyme
LQSLAAEQVEAIARDYRSAGLSPAEVAILSFAEKVVRQANQVRREDVDALRSQGLSDGEILDIAMAAAARSFFSKVIDAVGAEPEARYIATEPPRSD